MASNYRKLGSYIREIDRRNVENRQDNLLGLSVAKCFIPSIANTVGTDFRKYKIVEKGQFAYIPDTSRRGDKIAIALLESWERGLVSNVYTVFEVIGEGLLPQYLELWFRRPEFDRYARFKSHGSVREIFDWEQLCDVELPIPSISEQQRIVDSFNAIEHRINSLQQLNDKLAAWIDAMFSDISERAELTTTLDEYCDLVTERATFGKIAGGRYVSTETIGANKQGIKEFGSTRHDERVTHFVAGDTLMGNIRPYFKKVYFATVEGGCNGDVLCFRPKRDELAPIVYAAMFQDSFFDYVMSGAKGTKMPRGDKQHILKYPVPRLSDGDIASLHSVASSVQRLQTLNQEEIRALEALASAMLTTLSTH